MSRNRIVGISTIVALIGLLALPVFADGQPGGPIGDQGTQLSPAVVAHTPVLSTIELIEFGPLDTDALLLEDESRKAEGLPVRFAVPRPVEITPSTHGTWETLKDGSLLWQFRIVCADALSINLGFTRYGMPAGGHLFIQATDGSYSIRTFTDDDNKDHGELWTPLVLSDDILLELNIPADLVNELELELTAINQGYRPFGKKDDGGPRQGSCNNDVICPEGDDWRDEIQSVAVISTGGSTFCTGFMVNNTAGDETPYFMTANHCGINSSNDASLVCYWNFHSPTCGQLSGGSLSQNQNGSTHLASYSNSDVTLLVLDDDPSPAFNVTFAGWDRTSANPTSAVAIHHPNTDEKAISFEDDPCTTTTYLQESTPGDGTHIRVIDWDDGTTEPGSSGSPLFDQNHRVVGQLHGGYASCTSQTSDWYGRFSVSWTHGLSSYLDPSGTGATTVDTLVPGAAGLKVTPSSGFDSSGDPGGPFTPSYTDYTLENLGSSGINYTISKSESWVSLNNTGGYLPGSGTATVRVSINSNANSFGDGVYTDTVFFTNTTDHLGDTSRGVTLEVGGPSLVYSWPMNTNPGWTTQGQWAWGDPTGSSAEYGNPDPDNGYTGTNVYGYNLNGDYANGLSETHLTTTAIDCSDMAGVTLKFQRWLGVEVSTYDHAYLRVSNNGSNWTTIWENGNEMEGGAWELVEYDISSIADGQSNVYIRWTMGETDGSWQYCGWNIDDVEIWAIIASAVETCDDGILNQGETRIDCGGPCPACDCTSDGACNNDVFCDGEEYCDDYGECQDGSDCPDYCHEDSDTCYDCAGITPDGDMNANGTDGEDIQLFINALLGTPTVSEICHGDFAVDGELTTDDIAGMVNALLN